MDATTRIDTLAVVVLFPLTGGFFVGCGRDPRHGEERGTARPASPAMRRRRRSHEREQRGNSAEPGWLAQTKRPRARAESTGEATGKERKGKSGTALHQLCHLGGADADGTTPACAGGGRATASGLSASSHRAE